MAKDLKALEREIERLSAKVSRLQQILHDEVSHRAWYHHSNGLKSQALVTKLHRGGLADLIAFDAMWSGGVRDLQDVPMKSDKVINSCWSPKLSLEDLEEIGADKDIFAVAEAQNAANSAHAIA